MQGGFEAGKLLCHSRGQERQRRDHRRAGGHERAGSRERLQSGNRTVAVPACRSLPTWIRAERGTRLAAIRRHLTSASRSARYIWHQRRLCTRCVGGRTRGRTNQKVAIVGYDATPEARTAIAQGDMYGDAIQYPAKIGSTTIDVIRDYFAGTTPAAIVKIPVGAYTRANAQASP